MIFSYSGQKDLANLQVSDSSKDNYIYVKRVNKGQEYAYEV